MKIVVDKEGQTVLLQLLDIALKATGLQNLNGINEVIKIMKVEEAPLTEPVVDATKKHENFM